MEESLSSSSSSSGASFSSSGDVSIKNNDNIVKFLCSYGGKILPRYPDGKLRYFGGETRVLAVDRSIAYSELQVKLEELCGSEMASLRCQLPTEDLDALVSITSDDDLINLFEEFDLANRDKLVPLKIRAFLHEVKLPPRFTESKMGKRLNQSPVPVEPPPARLGRQLRGSCFNGNGGNKGHLRQLPVHHGNYWQ